MRPRQVIPALAKASGNCVCKGVCVGGAPSSTILIASCFSSSVDGIANPKFVALRQPAKLLVCKLGLCDTCLGHLQAVAVPVADTRAGLATHL